VRIRAWSWSSSISKGTSLSALLLVLSRGHGTCALDVRYLASISQMQGAESDVTEAPAQVLKADHHSEGMEGESSPNLIGDDSLGMLKC
jgi:hypothetical protein